jgi:hypothetical protein
MFERGEGEKREREREREREARMGAWAPFGYLTYYNVYWP